MKHLFLTIILIFTYLSVTAQQYDGIHGLIHTPTAEMDSVGTARIGAHFINKEMMPESNYFTWTDAVTGERNPYDTFSYYLSITPFRWVQASYTCVALARGPRFSDYTSKDRHFSVKFNPLREGRWWPSICLGSADFMGSTLDQTSSQDFFCNFYLSATKHFLLNENQIAVHTSYRYYAKTYNKKFQGIVGGITFRPSFASNFLGLLEWDGCHFNFGLEALLWKNLLLQASLQNGKYFSAGICYKVNLL